jgi:hypothetical protein
MNANSKPTWRRIGMVSAIGALALTAGLTTTAFSSSNEATANPRAVSAAGAESAIRPAIPSKRSVVIARAKTWLTANNGRPVPYSQTRYLNGWRTDCSGYASMAWNLRTSSGAPLNHNTDSMLRGGYGTPGPVVHPITWKDLKAGDAIGFLGRGSIGDAGHVMLFEKWANSTHTAYWVYEQSGDGGTHHRTHPISYNHYKPYRYNKILEG